NRHPSTRSDRPVSRGRLRRASAVRRLPARPAQSLHGKTTLRAPEMKITILDDWQHTIKTLAGFPKIASHDVTIWNDHTKDVDALAQRLKDTEALCLIRERTPIRAPLIDRLEKLRLISQYSVYPHVDVEACTKRGIAVSSFTG